MSKNFLEKVKENRELKSLAYARPERFKGVVFYLLLAGEYPPQYCGFKCRGFGLVC